MQPSLIKEENSVKETLGNYKFIYLFFFWKKMNRPII